MLFCVSRTYGNICVMNGMIEWVMDGKNTGKWDATSDPEGKMAEAVCDEQSSVQFVLQVW